MHKYFVDLHIHIGGTSKNKPVKITASRKLTFFNIISECVERKGIDIIGIVDCGAPGVINDIKELLSMGKLFELPGGGWRYLNKATIIPGVEVESKETNNGRGHFVSFFPGMKELEAYTRFLSLKVKNMNLSTQQSYLPAVELYKITKEIGGLFFPAHVFTPYKSLFGSCGNSLKDVFLEYASEIKFLELGLSSDTSMADKIPELHRVTYLTNSDAHSLEKIGREYNIFELETPDFNSLKMGKVIANYGLSPKLGKYHHTFCENCQKAIAGHLDNCPLCGGKNIVKGVSERIEEIGCKYSISPSHRPPYIHQVPLAFIPKIGKRTIDKLIHQFGNEMNVLHFTPYEALQKTVGEKNAKNILLSREGKLAIKAGGGGVYGRIIDT